MLHVSGYNQLLTAVLVDKLPLTNMALAPIGCPHFVRERATLAILMLEEAVPVLAGLELAHRLYVRKLASLHVAVPTIAARGHVGVLERTVSVGAVGVEFALLLILMCPLNSRRRMASDALPVLASSAK
jgi:hypothetical protein